MNKYLLRVSMPVSDKNKHLSDYQRGFIIGMCVTNIHRFVDLEPTKFKVNIFMEDNSLQTMIVKCNKPGSLGELMIIVRNALKPTMEAYGIYISYCPYKRKCYKVTL